MTITSGKIGFMNSDFCKLQIDSLEKSINLYNELHIRLSFYNPLCLELYFSEDLITLENSVTITSQYSHVTSNDIKEYILTIFN